MLCLTENEMASLNRKQKKNVEQMKIDIQAACVFLKEGRSRAEASAAVGKDRNWLSTRVSASRGGISTWIWRMVEKAENDRDNPKT